MGLSIKIKKSHVAGVCGIIAISLGLWLFQVLFEGLKKYGVIGYVFLSVFIICVILYIFYEKHMRVQKEIVKQVVDEVVRGYSDKYDVSFLKSEVENHLMKIVNDEDYKFLSKSSK